MKSLEGLLKDQIKRHLKSLPRCSYRMPVLSGYGQQFLDFVVCIDGKYLEIETKAPGKKPTPRQEVRAREVEAAGGKAFCCDTIEGYWMNMQLLGFVK